MKSYPLVAAVFASSLLLVGCHEEDILGEQLLSISGARSLETAAMNELLMKQTVADESVTGQSALEAVPVWKTLSYAEDLSDAYAERLAAIPEREAKFD